MPSIEFTTQDITVLTSMQTILNKYQEVRQLNPIHRLGSNFMARADALQITLGDLVRNRTMSDESSQGVFISLFQGLY